MRSLLVCKTPERSINVAWISFQPKNWISFGLSDAEFKVLDEAGQEVLHPHFTFHPPIRFHVKADGQGSKRLLEGIADVALALRQVIYIPWLKATTRPIALLPTGGSRSDLIDTEILEFEAPSEEFSINIKVGFVRPDSTSPAAAGVWQKTWGDVAVRAETEFTHPQLIKMEWHHNF